MRLSLLPHLVRRFFGSLRARAASPSEQAMLSATLSEPSLRLFVAQPAMDQRHALRTATRIPADAPARIDLVRAALLHDIGKTPSDLGVVGRSVASLLAMARLPRTSRMRSYLDHGAIGAGALDAAGETGIVLAFAAHHGRPQSPPGVDPVGWEILRRADHE
jgi:hypothetical protein